MAGETTERPREGSGEPGAVRRATVYDVARAAEVSIATVSFAFRRPDSVKPSTRERVLAAARALGQRPEDCLAMEDSGTGARAARDAGLRLIAVPAPGHPVPPADLALTSLTDPELGAWIATW
mgnify:CR=1 FL=1